MPNCVLHPGRASVATIFGKLYCERCKTGIEAARARVDRHVEPKECFVWYAANDDWQPIEGTGCAHWVSHQCGITSGGAGVKCMAGFTFRVKTVIAGKRTVALAAARADDYYVAPDEKHMGLVTAVRAGDPPEVTVRHCSIRRGGVFTDTYAGYFKGKGTFRR